MDIDKAKLASGLLERRDFVKKILDDATTTWSINPFGMTTITIPRTWLPDIIKKAKDELGQIEDEIAKL